MKPILKEWVYTGPVGNEPAGEWAGLVYPRESG